MRFNNIYENFNPSVLNAAGQEKNVEEKKHVEVTRYPRDSALALAFHILYPLLLFIGDFQKLL